MMKRGVRTVGLALIGVMLALFAGEAIVRIGTADQNTYVIEMWRYAKLLKKHSDDPAIGHEHRAGETATLQGVEVSLNALGMRGPELLPRDPARQRIAIIGDSMAFGWGLPEDQTLRGQLARRLGPDYEVFTTGIGNMNLRQVVAYWGKTSQQVEVDTVVVLSTMRATEQQSTTTPGWLVRNSQMVALAMTFASQFQSSGMERDGLIAAYRDSWTGPEGTAILDAAFAELAALQKTHGFRVIVAQIPETHDFQNYAFGFMSDIMAARSAGHGWQFIDLYPPFKGLSAPDLWVSKCDVHLNGTGVSMIADQILPYLGT